MDSSYPWGEGFQLRLLSLLARKPEKVLEIIEPQYFSLPMHVEISRVLKEIYAASPKTMSVEKTTLIEALRQTVGEDDAWDRYKDTAKTICKLSVPSDVDVLVQQATEFFKEARYKEALELAEKDVTNRRYEKVHERMDALKNLRNGHAKMEWENLPHPEDFPMREIDWTIEQLLPTDAAVALSGEEGTGKTLQALSWARSITEGMDFLGLRARHRKVLYLGIDTSKTTLNTYLQMMHWRPDEDFRFMAMWTGEDNQPPMLDNPADVARLCECSERFKPVIFFDVLRDFHEGEENSSTEMKPIMDAVRKVRSLGATPVLLVHPSKSGAHIRGSGVISQKVDIPYLVSKGKWHGKELCILSCPKKNRYGSPKFTIPMEMQFIPLGASIPYFRFKRRDDWNPAVAERAEEMAERREILSRLIRDNQDSSQRKLAKLAAEEEMGRDKAEEILKDGIGKYWTVEKGSKGKLIYRLLNQE